MRRKTTISFHLISKIIPIFKSGDSLETGNFRPISIISHFSKIIELSLFTRTYSYVAAALFLVESKALDTISRDLFLCKLYRYGLRGKSYDLINSYLTNRSQYVQTNNTKSNKLFNEYGMPQGSTDKKYFSSECGLKIIDSTSGVRLPVTTSLFPVAKMRDIVSKN